MPASSLGPEPRAGTIRVDVETDGIIAVCLDGDFDLANAPVLRDHIDSALETGSDLIVDLSEATFIDSSVISVLFDGARAVDGRAQTMVLQVATAPVVERALELVQVERVLRRAHSRTEAVRLIQQKAASA
jgi:anti-sigma B factor antagonist